MAKQITLTTPGAKALYSKSNLDTNFSGLNANFENYLHLGGTGEAGNSMLAVLDMGAFEVINSATPSAPLSLATKAYVDQVLTIGSTIGTIGSLVVDADGDTKVDTEVSADLDRLDLIAATSAGGIAAIQIIGDDSSVESLSNPSISLKKHVTMTASAHILDSAGTSFIEMGATTKFVQAAATVLDLSATTILASQNIEMAVGKKVGDLDNDTYIVFNEGSDDDTVRIYAGGVEQLTITASSVSIAITSVSGNFGIGAAASPTGATKSLNMITGTGSTTAADLLDNQVNIHSSVVSGIENKLNFDFKRAGPLKTTVVLGFDCVLPNDLTITNDLTVTGSIVAPTISSFANSQHAHTDAAAGGVLTISELVTTSLADAAKTFVVGEMNREYFIIPTSTTKILTLPTTDVTAGMVIQIHNLSSTIKITIESSSGGDIATFKKGGMKLVCNTTTPTTAAHWTILEVYGGARPAFHAFLTSQQVDITSTAVIEYNDVSTGNAFDNNGNYDAILFRWLPTVPGTYYVNGKIRWNNVTAGDDISILIRKNGTNVGSNRFDVDVTITEQEASGVAEMDGLTDYFDVAATNIQRNTSDVDPNDGVTYFQGYRV